MSGSELTAKCPNCGHVKTLRGKALTATLTCPSCDLYFYTRPWGKRNTKFETKATPAIAIGAKGKIDGVVYEVMGFCVKRENVHRYEWREYLLFNPYAGYTFLSEYDGHWNFFWPIDVNPRSKAVGDSFPYGKDTFNIYQKYRATVTTATGEFFFDVVDTTEDVVCTDYIAPPRILSLEMSEDSLLWVEGEYLYPEEVAEAFNIQKTTLPRPTGIGHTQPINTSFTEQSLISMTVIMMVLVFAIQMFFNSTSNERIVLQSEFNESQLGDQKMLMTEPFTLNDGTKSLTVEIYAPLSNDWFFAEFSLINETTGEEYNFTKEIEKYSGVEDGMTWSEGSQLGEAFLSKIPEGKYHINIYPEFSFSNKTFSLVVRRDVGMHLNFWIAWIAILLFPLGYYIRKRILEGRRWADSEYSPYATE